MKPKGFRKDFQQPVFEESADRLARRLHEAFCAHHKRELVSPDPLEFLYGYPDLRDREIVGLAASCLAYGNVKQIVRSVGTVLERLPSPAESIVDASEKTLRESFRDFKHRFTSGEDVADLLVAARRVMLTWGSIGGLVVARMRREDCTVVPMLHRFTTTMEAALGRPIRLLPDPERGSACKRLNLYMRWMVRRDAIDPGGWEWVGARRLIIPLDTHIHRSGLALGLTRRRAADLKTAIEITDALRRIAPEDPVKFDFCLMRMSKERTDERLRGAR
jgi:uncharacterized protein (TIGR02757 family)